MRWRVEQYVKLDLHSICSNDVVFEPCDNFLFPALTLEEVWAKIDKIKVAAYGLWRLMLVFLFGPEDGGDVLLRNVALCPSYAAVHVTVIPVRTSSSTAWKSSGLNFLHHLCMKSLLRGSGIDCAYECFNSTGSVGRSQDARTHLQIDLLVTKVSITTQNDET